MKDPDDDRTPELPDLGRLSTRQREAARLIDDLGNKLRASAPRAERSISRKELEDKALACVLRMDRKLQKARRGVSRNAARSADKPERGAK